MTTTDHTDVKKPVKSKKVRWVIAVALLAILAGGAMAVRGSGLMTWAIRKFDPSYGVRKWPAKLASSSPADFARKVPVDTVITATFRVSFGAIDPKSLNSQSVNLVRAYDQKVVPATMDMADPLTIRVKPNQPLDPRTAYQLHINAHLTDSRSVQSTPYILTFETAGPVDPGIVFEKAPQASTNGMMVTALVIGPDHKLYAGTDDGRIHRFPIKDDGSLGEPQVITSLKDHNKGKVADAPDGDRLLTGFVFDPASTPENPIIWVANGYPLTGTGMKRGFWKIPDLSGHITRMSGPNLEKVEDVVTGLPRSVKDHLTLQPAIGPDGALYFNNGSNSAMGAPDPIWGNRTQQRMAATMLRLDITKWKPGTVIDAKPPYDPFAKDALLTIYADGIRNAYDCVWHSNGHLYAPTNGSAAEGNTPEGPGAKGLKSVRIAEDDWLFDVKKGGFYGHPTGVGFNGHFVLNGGNPTPEYDFAEICEYPVGTQPDSAWQKAIYSFGQHVSANGTIEYKSDRFGGKLKGALIVCRYTDYYSDLVVLKMNADGSVGQTLLGLKGLTNLNCPLDLAEDPRNGNLYVSEYGVDVQRITLLRAK